MERHKEKRRRKRKESLREFKPWKPIDNLLLIANIAHGISFLKTFCGAKFSEHFTFKDIKSHWFYLLYNHVVTAHACYHINNLNLETKYSIYRKVLMNDEEQALICEIKSFEIPTFETFVNLLESHTESFHWSRTPKFLFQTWQKYRQRQWLSDQQYALKHARIFTTYKYREFHKREEQELRVARHKRMRDIRILEHKIDHMNIFVKALSYGEILSDFGPKIICTMTGKRVVFSVKARHVLLGRNTEDSKNDIDLAVEGPCSRISRQQATLTLTDKMVFMLSNVGQIPIIINGWPLLSSFKAKLSNESVITIDKLEFIFRINVLLIQKLRTSK